MPLSYQHIAFERDLDELFARYPCNGCGKLCSYREIRDEEDGQYCPSCPEYQGPAYAQPIREEFVYAT